MSREERLLSCGGAVCAEVWMAEDTASDPTATSALAGHPGLAQPNADSSCQENRSEQDGPWGHYMQVWLGQVGGWAVWEWADPLTSLGLSLPSWCPGHPASLQASHTQKLRRSRRSPECGREPCPHPTVLTQPHPGARPSLMWAGSALSTGGQSL